MDTGFVMDLQDVYSARVAAWLWIAFCCVSCIVSVVTLETD
jgi:hypothetical protein